MARLTLDLERAIPAPPATVWSLIADPALMNQWSVARIEPALPGDGGHPGGPGALRRVILPYRAGTLTEVVEAVDPPTHFEYRVIAGAPFVDHHGAIDIREMPSGSMLRWTITATPIYPGTGAIIARLLRRELVKSLDALADRAPSIAPSPPPPARDLDEIGPLDAARGLAIAVAEAQAALAARLLDAGDDRGWFARAQHHLTRAVIAAEQLGRYSHPAWALRLVPRFHAMFTDSVEGSPEAHWARAFRLIARHQGGDRTRRAAIVAFAGTRAHIEDDLPRALAMVYADHYRDRCDYARFRADHLRMDDVYATARDRLFAELPAAPWRLRRQNDKVFQRFAHARRVAFERGHAIANILGRGENLQ